MTGTFFLIVAVLIVCELLKSSKKKNHKKKTRPPKQKKRPLNKNSASQTTDIQPNTFYSRKGILTDTELKFYKTLAPLVSTQYTLMCKVNLHDIVTANKQHDQWRVNQKHVDFVLCDPETMKYVCVIELDDPSHNSADAKRRDAVKNTALAQAGIPLHRIPTQSSYSTDELRTRFNIQTPTESNPDEKYFKNYAA